MLPYKDPLVTYEMQLRSRYSETDKMGVVYHGRYLEYFEVIRTEFIREAGLSYAEMEERGVMLPVANVEIRFRRPVLYDELMNGRLMVFDEPGVRLVTYYDIRTAGSHQSSVTGKVELVFMDAATRRPIRAPEFFKQKMQSYAGMA